MKALIGRKIGMTQIFGDTGRATAVTLLEAKPCVITQIKTADKDGYAAIQLGLAGDKPANKPVTGHLKKSGLKNAVLREFKIDGESEAKIGDKYDVSQFEAGQAIEIMAVSKGKGFAGTIKRHNFKRGPKSHGSKSYRAPGSIGSMYPQKVFKRKKMAGRMGRDQVTLKKVKVMVVDAETNILAVRGAVPGPNKSLVVIRG